MNRMETTDEDEKSAREGSSFHEANLTKGMEHLRPYVSVPTTAKPTPHHAQQDPTTSKPNPAPLPSDLPQPDTPTYGIPSTTINPNPSPIPKPLDANPQKRTNPFQFGTRTLSETDDIFAFNAWDNVTLDPAYAAFASNQYELQRAHPVPSFDASTYNAAPERAWERFYRNNTSNFFKDRKWLFQEFPGLEEATKADAGSVTVLEVGAGAGNTAFPLVRGNKNEGLRVHAVDYAKEAVEVMRRDELCDGWVMRADVWDVASVGEDGDVSLPPGLERGSVDIVVLIFVFSALAPGQWAQALRNLEAVLRPGGEILFRDYGRGDLAQVRFKKGRWLGENFYVRGDGTRVYFFEEEELRRIFGEGVVETSRKAGGDGEGVHEVDEATDEVTASRDEMNADSTPKFEVLNLAVDRRMLVNRQRRLKMYRCWMQGRFKKPLSHQEGGEQG